ncbi:MAG: glycoside hydrolase family 2 TIM barrel-domain containing protein [Armatimonadota bacterium]|nr:glycoside hydrolase family 2 [Armatimonadota bacterium]MDW8026433.1 glycoside hydrolase family 2 TIM barrel-domain containing protein [Armatimonadota bacterium]
MRISGWWMHFGWLYTIILFSLATAVGSAQEVGGVQWQPEKVPLMTVWAEKVNPSLPHPEYPRPQMVRQNWVNLNGLWDYAIVDRQQGSIPEKWDGKILVPFPIESALSGVRKPLEAHQYLWYRRTFMAPKLTNSSRLLLHFGAVDWEAAVFVNGKEVGKHRGGYDSFSFDITKFIKSGENELLVRVWDPTEDGVQARGKQMRRAMREPSGIMYTPCSGIWQTVWLEVVPESFIERLKVVPNVDENAVIVTAHVANQKPNMSVEVLVRDAIIATSTEPELDFSKVAIIAKAKGTPNEPVKIELKQPRLWSPDSPFLYGLQIRLLIGEREIDAVKSYFGMRKVSLGKDENGFVRILLNGKFVFQVGPLDQGFFPDGIYTAPTDEALRFDVDVMKKLGFNAVRKHVKREPQRWYYWCDRLGLLVWQDMPSSSVGRGSSAEREGFPISPECAEQFERELCAMVEQLFNHPSIIMWIIFNEGWGQYDTARLVEIVKKLDQTRLVNGASGWHVFQSVGDVIDIHSYPGPASPKPDGKRALVLGEFGGLGLILKGHTWIEKGWGYRTMPDEKALTKAYLRLWQRAWELKDTMGLSGAIYTQLTDVETECNGLLTYDRKVIKMPVEIIAKAVLRGEFPGLPRYKVVVPTAQDDEKIRWKYTFEKPADDWFKPEFNDSGWKEGIGGFGVRGTPGAIVRTEWRTSDIWLRREFTLPPLAKEELSRLMLRIHHDEDAEVYINGVLAARLSDYTTDYEEVSISPEAIAALKPGGKNIIAIHCHQTVGGQYIDAGLVIEVQSP